MAIEVNHEVRFLVSLPEVPEAHRLEAEQKAQEIFIMTLLKHGDISAGHAAEQLGVDRWQLSELMDAYAISPFPFQTQTDLADEVNQVQQRMDEAKL